MTALYKVAGNLAAEGLAVFPVKPNSKYPYKGFQWTKRATSDPAAARALFKEYPDSNIAIACGKCSRGLVVIDIDVKKGAKGLDSLRKLEDRYGDLHHTAVVITPSKGQHLYFIDDIGGISNSVGTALGPGIDVRSDGGLVVAPPSIIDGNPYRWLKPLDALTELPKPLHELLVKPQSGKATPKSGDGVVEGSRNVTLTKFAGSLRRQNLDKGSILKMLRLYNEEHCKPPLEDREVKAIAESIGSKPAGEEKPAEPYVLKDHIESVTAMLDRDIPPVSYLMDGLLAKGATAILAGPPKGLKSTLALWLALVLVGAIESNWSKFKPTVSDGLRVGYLDLEQADPLFLERLQQFNPDKEMMKGRFFRVDAFPKFDAEGIAKLEELITAKKLDLIIVDTLARVRPLFRGMGASEADASLLDPVTKLARRTGCHILIVAHNGKRKDHDNPIEMLAATSALAGAVDDVLVLSKPLNAETELRRNFYVTGRHIREPGTYLLDRTATGFEFLGDAGAVLEGQLQKKVLAYLRAQPNPVGAKAIAAAIGDVSRIAVQKVLAKLAFKRLVTSDGAGRYEDPTSALKRRKG